MFYFCKYSKATDPSVSFVLCKAYTFYYNDVLMFFIITAIVTLFQQFFYIPVYAVARVELITVKLW